MTYFASPIFDAVVLGMPGEAYELHRLFGSYGARLRQLGPVADGPRWGQQIGVQGAAEVDVIDVEIVDDTATLDIGLIRARMRTALSSTRPDSVAFVELIGEEVTG